MTKATAEKILERLDKIEAEIEEVRDLVGKSPREKELTEEDVLKIVEEGRREYREGKTLELDTLFKEKYPHLLKRK